MRLSSAQLADRTARQRTNFGEIPMETEGGQLIPVPPGSSAPTAPGRTPTRSLPRLRDATSLAEPLIDVACALFNPNPGGFVDRYLDFSEYTSSRSVADGMMRSICGDPPGSPQPTGSPSIPLPPSSQYEGGQCEGDSYVGTAAVTYIDFRDEEQTKNWTLYGPANPGIGPLGPLRPVLNSDNGVNQGWTWRMFDALGRPSGNVNYTVEGTGPGTVSANISRLDGGTDDCGNPPADPATDPTSPTPSPLPPSTYDPGDGGPPVAIAPNISIEIGEDGPRLRFTLPDLNIDIDPGGVNFGYPDVPAKCCPANEPGPSPEDILPEPDAGPPEPPPPTAPPVNDSEDETETTIRAVRVDALSINTPATLIAPSNGSPNVYAPRLGSLFFKIRTGDGGTSWTKDIDIKTDSQYIEVPAIQGAVNVKVFAFGQTQFKVTRYYTAIESELGVPT